MTRIAIIPARGGSVRIPRKNIRDFKGKPMMQWPIEALQASYLFDQIIVSTDDEEIRRLATALGCGFHSRPEDNGTMGTQEIASRIATATRYAYELIWPADEYCVVYPCTPMLRPSDLWFSLGQWRQSGAPFAKTVLTESSEGGGCWDGPDAGALYWGNGCAFRRRAPLEGNCLNVRVDRTRFIDINTPEDWAKAESMFDALRMANDRND